LISLKNKAGCEFTSLDLLKISKRIKRGEKELRSSSFIYWQQTFVSHLWTCTKCRVKILLSFLGISMTVGVFSPVFAYWSLLWLVTLPIIWRFCWRLLHCRLIVSLLHESHICHALFKGSFFLCRPSHKILLPYPDHS